MNDFGISPVRLSTRDSSARYGQAPRGLLVPAEANASSAMVPRSTSEWLESPLLSRIARRVACQYGISQAEIDDLLQEVRIALWETDPRLEIKPRWVFVTTSHKAVDILRRRWHFLSPSFVSAGIPGEAAELQCLARAQVSHLPRNLRVFCDLRYAEGLTEREIARRMGLCRASVRWLGLRCLKALRIGGASLV